MPESADRIYDEFIKFRRNIEDILENLSLDNFRSDARSVIAEGSKAKAGLEAMADEVKAMAKVFAEFDGSLAEIRAESTEQSAKISSLTKYQAELDGEVGEAVTMINQVSSAGGAFIQVIASANGYNVRYDAGRGEYIFTKGAEEYTAEEADVAGMFIQSVNGGDTSVTLKADRINFGENASVDAEGNLRITRLWHTGSRQFYAQVGDERGSYADFGVYDDINGYYAWRFYNNDMGTKVIHLRFYEDDVLGYNGSQGKVYPKGVWDFSSCDVRGLGVVPVFG